MNLRSWIFCCLCLVLSSNLALATLGEPLISIQADAGKLKAAQKSATSTGLYSTSEMVADGNTIKQFANREGLVFAVSWTGISKPDLQVLFGAYYQEYLDGTNELPKQMGAKTAGFKTSNLVIRRIARMRHQRGLAVVPSLVPEGVKIEDLK